MLLLSIDPCGRGDPGPLNETVTCAGASLSISPLTLTLNVTCVCSGSVMIGQEGS